MIPKILHRVWVGPMDTKAQKVLSEGTRTFLEHHDGWNVLTWFFETCKITKTYVQESDLRRLDALWIMGGVYVDCDMLFLGNIESILDQDLVVSSITLPGGERVPNNCLVASTPRHPSIKKLREDLHANVQKNPYGHVLDTTGPLAYRQAIEGAGFTLLGEDVVHEPTSHRKKLPGCPMVHQSLMIWQKTPQWP